MAPCRATSRAHLKRPRPDGDIGELVSGSEYLNDRQYCLRLGHAAHGRDMHLRVSMSILRTPMYLRGNWRLYKCWKPRPIGGRAVASIGSWFSAGSDVAATLRYAIISARSPPTGCLGWRNPGKQVGVTRACGLAVQGYRPTAIDIRDITCKISALVTITGF
jgi:hypothetical protein